METAQPTAGIWRANTVNCITTTADDKLVGTAFDHATPKPEAHANARLFAASKDLRDALQAFVDQTEAPTLADHDHDTSVPCETCHAYERRLTLIHAAKAALAKASPRTQGA